MKTYHVTIRADKYPTDYTVSGKTVSWQGAISKAINQWRKRFKGSRTEEMHIRVIRSTQTLTSEDHVE